MKDHNKRGTLPKSATIAQGTFIANADHPFLYSNVQLLLSANAMTAGAGCSTVDPVDAGLTFTVSTL